MTTKDLCFSLPAYSPLRQRLCTDLCKDTYLTTHSLAFRLGLHLTLWDMNIQTEKNRGNRMTMPPTGRQGATESLDDCEGDVIHMPRPSQSPHLNPTERLREIPDRRVRQRSPPPSSTRLMREDLLKGWHFMPLESRGINAKVQWSCFRRHAVATPSQDTDILQVCEVRSRRHLQSLHVCRVRDAC